MLIGGLATPVLHAQGTQPAFLVIANEVLKPDDYKNNFLPVASANIKSHGGVYVAAGEGVKIEGNLPVARVAVIRFDSMDALKSWQSSADWQDTRKKGDGLANFNFIAVNGVKQ
jgi:uncharacterized protein (DUF1330 family)